MDTYIARGGRNMKLKKIILIAIITTIVLLSIGFSLKLLIPKQLDEDTEIVVIFKTMDQSIAFWQVVNEGINNCADEFGVNVKIVGTQYETQVLEQIQIINNVLADKPDAIILAASDYFQLEDIANKINDQKIPLITIDSSIHNNPSLSFVATDNIEAGKKAGNEMANALDNKGAIVIMSHLQGTSTAIEREQGVRESLAENNMSAIHDTLFCDNNVDIAYEIMKQYILDHRDIKGVVCLNEPSTVGVARAIDDINLSGKVKIVGFDSSNEEIKYIEKGTIQTIIVQNPFLMGYTSLEVTIKALLGEQVEKIINTGSIIVTKENLHQKETQKLLFPFIE